MEPNLLKSEADVDQLASTRQKKFSLCSHG